MFRYLTGQPAVCLILSLLLTAGTAAFALTQPPQPATGPSTQPASQPISAWQADLDALEQPITLPAPRGSDSRSFTRHLGNDIPRSLITLNAIQLPVHRGYTFTDAFNGTAAEYAAHLMSLRIDQLFEEARGSQAIELAQRLAGGRMRFGASRWIPTPPRLSILPDWLLPIPRIDLNPDVARDLQVAAQRLDDAGNFAGFVITGADRWTAAYLSDRLHEVAASWIVTPGDFDGITFPDSGEGLFSHLAVQQVQGLSDPAVPPPLYGVSLIDRLRSYHPHKQTWAIIDHAGGKLSRHELHRAYALALTRGIDAIGVNWLPLPGGPQSEQAIADLREIHEWTHRLGGVYGMTEPIPTIGVLYVHQQARRSPGHAGMTSEAMILCHAAGYPSRMITPEELQRGLPDAMKAVLLVGLDRADEQWVWHHGLEEALRKYTDQGGRFVIDERSVAPVPAIKPGLTVADWFDTASGDDIAAVLERNERNIAHLREALADVARPIGYSDDPTLWAIPSLAGNVEYVTVVSTQTPPDGAATDTEAASDAPPEAEPGDEPAANDSPMIGQIEWTSSRPVYDVRTRRKLSAEEARSVDLSAQGFHLYALPPVEPPAPSIHVEVDEAGCFTAHVTSGDVRGLPIEVTISREMASEKIHRATGEPFRLPLQIYDEPGEYDIAVTELVTGQSAGTRIVVPANAPPRRQNPASDRLARFAGRKDQPLVIALTEAQQTDAQITALAERLAAHFRSIDREVRIATAAPDPDNGIVLTSNPPADAPRPRWRTQGVDLILLGTPRDNVLIRDQALGRLLPPRVETPETHITWSAFAPNRQVLNLLGDGAAALTVLVEQIERDAR